MPTATPPLTGRAAFGGTWDGTVSEPGWTTSRWTVELVIPESGNQGSYSAPSLGCSGALHITGTASSTMTAHVNTNGTGTGCAKTAALSLSLTGSELDMTWAPNGPNKAPGTGTLSSG